MPGSFPGRTEGEPFHVRCGLNLPPFLFALTASRAARLRRPCTRRPDVSMRTISDSFPRSVCKAPSKRTEAVQSYSGPPALDLRGLLRVSTLKIGHNYARMIRLTKLELLSCCHQ